MHTAPHPEYLLTDGRGGFLCGSEKGRILRRWHGWWVARRPPREREQWLAGVEMWSRVGESFVPMADFWHGEHWNRGLVTVNVPDAMALRFTHFFPERFASGDLSPDDLESGPMSCAWQWTPTIGETPAIRLNLYVHSMGDDASLPVRVRPLMPGKPTPSRLGENLFLLRESDGLRLLLRSSVPLEVCDSSVAAMDVEMEHERACEAKSRFPLFAGPEFEVLAKANEPVHLDFIVARANENPDELDVRPLPAFSDDEEEDEIGKRRGSISLTAFARTNPYLGRVDDAEALESNLADAADQFIVSTASGRKTIMAGYPWFTDWGRDAMISLPGLCIATGRLDDAAEILDNFMAHMNQGLIPNVFPEHGEQPRYNTIDATLWMFEAAFRLESAMRAEGRSYLHDARFAKLAESLDWHVRGTHNDIAVDADGLLAGGSEGSQLTWMDVKINGHVPTPRHGKPVEIQGLWYNALVLMAEEAERRRMRSRSVEWSNFAHQCARSFAERYFDTDHEHAADVVDRDGPGTADFTLRPNMAIPFALHRNVIPEERRAGILRATAAKLLTPRGLRTLDPDHPDYRAIYSGPVERRDLAYHNGTVWMWLIAPYLKGVLDEGARVPELLAQVPAILEGLVEHFTGEACAHQASEIFDGDYPHVPRGCFAQAWSVAATIEALTMPW